ncbi:hypothetical protein GCM10009825_35550 [Arthrobacter humicola]|uniref:Uncharacterized protein n=1 Tax=Arthrobacter humicola TaxID=409291 RepID=A0ABP5LAQ5_9MICC
MQQPARRQHYALQDCIQTQVLGHRHNRFQQSGHAFLRLLEFLGPGTKTLQQLLETGIWLGGGMAMALTRRMHVVAPIAPALVDADDVMPEYRELNGRSRVVGIY